MTLYSFLYSLKYPIKELQIKILPGHVCLHFRGMDIEATSGTFKHYSKHDGVLPITELITTNLLDVADAEAKTKKIDQRVMLKRAHLAYLVSSKRELVERNLEIAYRNLGAKLMNEKKFDSAIFYLEKLKDPKLLNMAYHNGAIYFLKRKNFRRARYFAKRSGKDDLLRACYMGEYREVSKKVRGIKSISKAKTYKATYRKMLNLARKGGDNKAEASVRKILKQL